MNSLRTLFSATQSVLSRAVRQPTTQTLADFQYFGGSLFSGNVYEQIRGKCTTPRKLHKSLRDGGDNGGACFID